MGDDAQAHISRDEISRHLQLHHIQFHAEKEKLEGTIETDQLRILTECRIM